MRIGFDAKRAFHNRTGLGNYSRTLFQNLKRYYPNEEYVYFTPNTRSDYSRLFIGEEVITPSRKNPLWRSVGIKRNIRDSGIEVYHGLSNELPFGIHKTGLPSVVTIHDVIFDIVKEDFPWMDRLVYRRKTIKCIRESTRIIAISEATKLELLDRFDADPAKIEVIYQPISDQFLQTEIPSGNLAQIKTLYQLPEQYLLYVGALMKRKNILPMIQAWERLPESYRIPLLIFGNGNHYKNKVTNYLRSKGLDSKVHLRTSVPFQHLPVLYRLSECVLYPSLHEGFGLPVLEALACGTRVVTSSVSSMPEAGGELPEYIDPESVESITDGIMRSLAHSRPDPVKLTEHLSQFDSHKVTQQMMKMYREVRE